MISVLVVLALTGSAAGDLSEAGADTCLSCHNDDSMLQIFRTPHGSQVDPSSPMAQLQCESCHGPGGPHSDRTRTGSGHVPVIDFGDEAQVSVADQEAVCMSCHTGDVGMPWTGSVHERNDTSCVSCHQVHTPSDPVLTATQQNEVCFDCHRRQRSDSMKPFAHPVRFDLMTCTACHNPHHSTTDALLKRATVNELCWSCHTELRGPFLFDHPPASEDCSLCHQPHGSIHPAMLTRRPPLLCQSCHSQRGHPSISFTADSAAGGSNPSAMVVNDSCMNCHSQVHGSNHPSGATLMR